MQDKAVHDYSGIDLEVVWRTVREDLPHLRASIARIMDEMEKGEKGA